MSLGRRRTRPNRAYLRPSHSLEAHRERQARRRARWAQIAIACLSAVLVAVIVHGPSQPFPYRPGQRPTRDIRVNVPSFEVKNERKTNIAVQGAADKVAPILDNDPAPLRKLAERLVELTETISEASNLDALPAPVLASWNISPATFDAIKAATSNPELRADLKRQVLQAFAPIEADGVLGPDTLPRQEKAADKILVRSPQEAPRHVAMSRLEPERLTKPDGPVALEFIAAFSSRALGEHLFALIQEPLRGAPTLVYDERGTAAARKAARDAVRDVYDRYERGDLLVEQDQPITDDQITLLHREQEVAEASLGLLAHIQRAGSIVLLVGALFALIGYHIVRYEPKLARSVPRIATLCGLAVVTMGTSSLLALEPWDAELIPVALSAMILAIAYNPHFALMFAFGSSLLTSLALGAGLSHFIVLMGGTALGVLPLEEVRTRTKPIQVGAAAAAGFFFLTWTTGLWQNQPRELVLADSLWRAGWGLMAGFFLGGSLPFVENVFGIVTGISLLELGDINHPLLQELVRRAPGTHNHSVAVGTIAEAAAERVGADPVLVRVGAYFHDIGKMLKPHYFIENQNGAVNRHDSLAPAMSTLIIIGHVKDGAELARQHHLPEPIVEFIEQHHGTTLVEYFYREATRRSNGNPDEATVLETDFRYPGPKPQSREAAIVMIADAVESASRTLSEPTAARIEGLVSSLIEKRLQDGQFDECGLTLREISTVRDSLIKSLIGIYHGRVKYPEQRTA